ncbi:predicted protein [Histoplasma capsulatum var. duboisii H88]|uniref:Predicted protein n=2 Tax=Ajellomyces capsulatus TaxID=5037 RepID=F0UKY6_AJEC8|nr:predicted protein [Histoplasma capsulatum H143]EGC46090.1 predicted protein [Histoplasma capsulatum var. duboisii H88]
MSMNASIWHDRKHLVVEAPCRISRKHSPAWICVVGIPTYSSRFRNTSSRFIPFSLFQQHFNAVFRHPSKFTLYISEQLQNNHELLRLSKTLTSHEQRFHEIDPYGSVRSRHRKSTNPANRVYFTFDGPKEFILVATCHWRRILEAYSPSRVFALCDNAALLMHT